MLRSNAGAAATSAGAPSSATGRTGAGRAANTKAVTRTSATRPTVGARSSRRRRSEASSQAIGQPSPARRTPLDPALEGTCRRGRATTVAEEQDRDEQSERARSTSHGTTMTGGGTAAAPSPVSVDERQHEPGQEQAEGRASHRGPTASRKAFSRASQADSCRSDRPSARRSANSPRRSLVETVALTRNPIAAKAIAAMDPSASAPIDPERDRVGGEGLRQGVAGRSTWAASNGRAGEGRPATAAACAPGRPSASLGGRRRRRSGCRGAEVAGRRRRRRGTARPGRAAGRRPRTPTIRTVEAGRPRMPAERSSPTVGAGRVQEAVAGDGREDLVVGRSAPSSGRSHRVGRRPNSADDRPSADRSRSRPPDRPAAAGRVVPPLGSTRVQSQPFAPASKRDRRPVVPRRRRSLGRLAEGDRRRRPRSSPAAATSARGREAERAGDRDGPAVDLGRERDVDPLAVAVEPGGPAVDPMEPAVAVEEIDARP